jgi:uncharacterized membrane protein required for colicin V production
MDIVGIFEGFLTLFLALTTGVFCVFSAVFFWHAAKYFKKWFEED